MRACEVVITGRVQGVGYRNWTAKLAERLGLFGWVRNQDDGSVRTLFYGSKESVDEAILACSKGPTFASVKEVEIVAEGSGDSLSQEYDSFVVLKD